MGVTLRGILVLTLRELWAMKTIVALFIISTLAWIFFSFALNVEEVEGSLVGLQIFGQEAIPQELLEEPLPGEERPSPEAIVEEVVVQMEASVAGLAYWIATLMTLFATAPLFNTMLERGRVELLLAKPYRRWQFFAGHVLGVLLVMTVLATYLIGAVWLVISLKSGVWNPQLLLSIPILVGMFASLHALILLISVWTESTALALIVTYGVVFLSFAFALHENILPTLGTAGRAFFLFFYHLLPNFSEVTGIISQLSQQLPVQDWYPLFSSLGFGALAYVIAGAWFEYRDF